MERKTIWDTCGNRLGEDVITIDRDGRTHITHYDAGGRCVGRSEEKTDWRGDTYIDHTDASGHSLGHSTLEKDWWGDYYIRTEQTRSGREQAEAARKEAERRASSADTDDESNSGAEIIGDILCGLLMLLGKLLLWLLMLLDKPLLWLLMFYAVLAAGFTVWFFLLVLSPLISLLAAVGPPVIVLLGVLALSYLPYVSILLYRRWKKEIGWKDFSRAVLRWALIGPFAYRKLGQAERLPSEAPEPSADSQRRFCAECGSAAAPGEHFCKHCGAKLHEN